MKRRWIAAVTLGILAALGLAALVLDGPSQFLAFSLFAGYCCGALIVLWCLRAGDGIDGAEGRQERRYIDEA